MNEPQHFATGAGGMEHLAGKTAGEIAAMSQEKRDALQRNHAIGLIKKNRMPHKSCCGASFKTLYGFKMHCRVQHESRVHLKRTKHPHGT